MASEVDVAVIGAGFAGLYTIHRFRNVLGMTVQAFDDAEGVGGTWFWNRYPGARSDTEVSAYCYSFDRDIFFSWQWTARYPRQAEILAYLETIADRHDLRRSITFGTRVLSMRWDEERAQWILKTDKGEELRARWVVEGVGLLSSINQPSFQGQETFGGKIYHTARWPHDVFPENLAGKRVGIVGTGSSGVQAIAELAPLVGELVVFQRSPQYVVPSQNRPIAAELIAKANADYAGYWKGVLGTVTAFGFEESAVSGESVGPEEREAVFAKAWDDGGGFQYMFKTFNDVGVSRVANDAAASYIRKQIARIVKDPATAALLTPYDLYAKRPLCCDGYYEAYNLPTVKLVNAKANPILRFVPEGIETADGTVHALDVVVLATGFDAVTGNYLKIETVGRNGARLADRWKDRAHSYLGLFVHGFPNLATIFGPMGPFTNQPPVHEYQVEFVSRLFLHLRQNNLTSAEPTAAAEGSWMDACDAIAAGTLFPQCDSWINGANLRHLGKPVSVYFYMGGMAEYAKLAEKEEEGGWKGFEVR